MATNLIPPTGLAVLQGKITTKPRPFHEVVADFRHVVFSVIRLRPEGAGFRSWALGSGFFIGPNLFLTCHHVVDSLQKPHQDGDTYQLVNNLGKSGVIHVLDKAVIGKDIYLFPERDAALLNIKAQNGYAALDFRDLILGREIGVAGYPLPMLRTDANGSLAYDGLIYRVAKNVITATVFGSSRSDAGPPTDKVWMLEVNFLFVAGNSGGPVFDSQTGRVIGYVHGYRASRIREQLVDTDLPNLPQGVGTKYVESIHAIYSIAFAVTCLRDEIEKRGIHA
jgi:S1-C subfamily serine protease